MDRLAEACEEIAKYSSKLRKIQILSRYFATLSDADFALAVRFLSSDPIVGEPVNETLFETGEKRRLAVGPSILRDALQRVTGWDAPTLRICYREVGDTGETTALLLDGIAAGEPLSLAQADAYFRELFRTRVNARKTDLLTTIYARHRPLAVKYFVKVISGDLRIGLLEKMVEEAIAASCGIPPDLVRQANNRVGDLALVAAAARHGTLHEIEARLFHPMDFMLAKPLANVEDIPSPDEYIIEDKYDGIRSHVHASHGATRIYSRGMEDVTGSFPEIVEAFSSWSHEGILDGEILAWRENRALSFNLLQQRISRKSVKAIHRTEIPVVFMAYDLLFEDGQLLVDVPFEERRRRLEDVLRDAGPTLVISPQFEVASHADVNRLFDEARERGNEGLLLKRKGSLYEPSKRTGAWYKLKRPYGTLDVVITAAEQGSGRRATVLSDYTFAVRSGDHFLNVGKAYSGLTDDEIRELTQILRSISTEKFGRVMLVRPQIVIEVAFDSVQKSNRHKSGYALRFPRIVRWRRDKRPEEADDLERVRELYDLSLR